jgi:hypothetical protein
MNEKYIIDRVEGNCAIVESENGSMNKIPIENIKGDFKEGDILINKEEYFEIDRSLTLNRKKQVYSNTKNMWKE